MQVPVAWSLKVVRIVSTGGGDTGRGRAAGEGSPPRLDRKNPSVKSSQRASCPRRGKGVQRLTDGGVVLRGAGVGITAQTLSVLMFHRLENPDIVRRLEDGLVQAMLDAEISLPGLHIEQVPFRIRPGSGMK